MQLPVDHAKLFHVYCMRILNLHVKDEIKVVVDDFLQKKLEALYKVLIALKQDMNYTLNVVKC